MKNAIVLCLVAAAAISAPAQTTKKKTSKPAAPAAVTIPKDAVPNPDGNSYTWTDKDGKKWVFAKTPFGIMKSPMSDTTAAAGAPAADPTLKAIDLGETVKFERKGPFGPITWEKKKADLNDGEKAALEAQKAPQQ